jgi:hypothetical protein
LRPAFDVTLPAGIHHRVPEPHQEAIAGIGGSDRIVDAGPAQT